ncbi:TPA: hypothetical protein ACNGY5_006447, partial [Klebsiella michiganensis]
LSNTGNILQGINGIHCRVILQTKIIFLENLPRPDYSSDNRGRVLKGEIPRLDLTYIHGFCNNIPVVWRYVTSLFNYSRLINQISSMV